MLVEDSKVRTKRHGDTLPIAPRKVTRRRKFHVALYASDMDFRGFAALVDAIDVHAAVVAAMVEADNAYHCRSSYGYFMAEVWDGVSPEVYDVPAETVRAARIEALAKLS